MCGVGGEIRVVVFFIASPHAEIREAKHGGVSECWCLAWAGALFFFLFYCFTTCGNQAGQVEFVVCRREGRELKRGVWA